MTELIERLPDPAKARSLDDLTDYLRRLRNSANDISYRDIQRRVVSLRSKRGAPEPAPSLATLHRYFQFGRNRMDYNTIIDIGTALGLDGAGVESLRKGCRLVIDHVSRSRVVETARDIPAPVPWFTGRRVEAEHIAEIVDSQAPDSGPLIISIEGMGGIGKTELARKVGRDLRATGRVAEIAFNADLRGYDPDEPTADAAAVLRGFLTHLGVPNRQINSLTPGGRVQRLQSELAGRRALILLDDAADDEQVRPLIPADAPCVVIVTSRRQLNSLPGARRLPLSLMPVDDSLELLRRQDPVGRIDAEPGVALDLVRMCCQLPEELAAVGRQLTAKPDWTLADHIERLRHFPAHEASHPKFAASYRNQPEPARRLFRLLAIYPGKEFTIEAAAALAGRPAEHVRPLLRRLCEEHLIIRKSSDSYRFHGSMHAYARRLAHREEPASGRRAAMARLPTRCRVAAA
ncbi:MAG: NB-ARC domain-containing protein [Stackebrandtia sp.]